jgi:hypothetical protein
MSHTTPSAILEQLDAAELRRRLAELDAERAALLVLLRAARARERRLPPAPAGEKGGRP